MKSRLLKNKKQGFTLVEVVFMTFFVAVAFVSLNKIYTQLSRDEEEKGKEIMASNLAQEMAEIIQGIRDFNYQYWYYNCRPIGMGGALDINGGVNRTDADICNEGGNFYRKWYSGFASNDNTGWKAKVADYRDLEQYSDLNGTSNQARNEYNGKELEASSALSGLCPDGGGGRFIKCQANAPNAKFTREAYLSFQDDDDTWGTIRKIKAEIKVSWQSSFGEERSVIVVREFSDWLTVGTGIGDDL